MLMSAIKINPLTNNIIVQSRIILAGQWLNRQCYQGHSLPSRANTRSSGVEKTWPQDIDSAGIRTLFNTGYLYRKLTSCKLIPKLNFSAKVHAGT